MPKYMWKVSYTKAGARGVAEKGASSRRDAVKQAIESVGGRFEAAYFAFGDADVYVIGDVPDQGSRPLLKLVRNLVEAV